MPDYKAPGVYINELGLFPGSIVPVASAVPAFIGHTPRAARKRRSLRLQPTRVTSFAEFQSLFGALATDRSTPAPDSAQIAPRFRLEPALQPDRTDLMLGKAAWNLEATGSSLSYFYLGVKLFYANGGGPCYIVSVGRLRTTTTPSDPHTNPNLKLDDLLAGLTALERETEPTMVVVPDATLLKKAECAALNRVMLLHCEGLRSRIALHDVRGAVSPSASMWANDIADFRTGLGETGLKSGAAYYPFLRTTILAPEGVSAKNLGGARALRSVLSDASTPAVDVLLTHMSRPSAANHATFARLDADLRAASPDYARVHAMLLERVNTLPASSAIAGVITTIDTKHGVWKSPANVALKSVTDVTIAVTDRMQELLNFDSASGKSINAIRVFPGKGILVWGARTLDGNSPESRYISVRRTSIMIGQSIKQALLPFVFEPNEPITWSNIQRLVESFLNKLWRQGALIGTKPEQAYMVRVGLGSSMTADDVSRGVLRVDVMLALLRPGEFHVLTFHQQQKH